MVYWLGGMGVDGSLAGEKFSNPEREGGNGAAILQASHVSL